MSFCRRVPQQQQLLPSLPSPADPHRPNGWWRYHFSFLNPLRVLPNPPQKTAVFRRPPTPSLLPYRSIIIILWHTISKWKTKSLQLLPRFTKFVIFWHVHNQQHLDNLLFALHRSSSKQGFTNNNSPPPPPIFFPVSFLTQSSSNGSFLCVCRRHRRCSG